MRQVTETELKKRLAFDNPWWGIGGGVDPEYREMKPRAYFEPFKRLVTARDVRKIGDLGSNSRIGKGAGDILQGAKTLAEGDLCVVGEGLVVEDEQRILVEEVPDFGKYRIVERARQVEAIDFDSEIRMQFVELQSHSRASAATDIRF